MRSDWLGLRLTSERGNFLPEVIQHGVRRGVAVVSSAVHFTPGDHIYPCNLLLQNRGLRSTELGIREVTRRELS